MLFAASQWRCGNIATHTHKLEARETLDSGSVVFGVGDDEFFSIFSRAHNIYVELINSQRGDDVDESETKVRQSDVLLPGRNTKLLDCD